MSETDAKGVPDDEEQEWIRRCRNGSRRAYEPLVRRYAQWAEAYAFRRVGNRDEARDLAQEAFIRAYNAMPRFRPGRPFLPWLLRILDHLCLDHRRRFRPSESLEEYREAADDDGTKAVEDRLLLDRGLSRLSADQRRVVLMKDRDGFDHREVAGRLGIPEGTVMSRLHAARRRLRWFLRGRGARRRGGSE